MKERTRSTSKKQQRSKTSSQNTQYYLKEILKNIETLQSTILQKLDHASQRQKESKTPQTPSKLSIKTCSCKKQRLSYESPMCRTKRDERKITLKINKPHESPFLSINPSDFKEEVLKQLNKTPVNYIKPRINFATTVRERQYKSNILDRSIHQMQYSVRTAEKPKENKENQFLVAKEVSSKNAKTQRDLPESSRPQLSRQKCSIQLIQPSPSQLMTSKENDIQTFYKRQIEWLELQGKIQQLEQELKDCISSKRALESNPAQSISIRARMKNISLQLSQLRQQREALKQ